MEYILILGMLLGGINFLIHYRVLKGQWKALGDNTEMRLWWGLIAGFVLIILLERTVKAGAFLSAVTGTAPFLSVLEENTRLVLFQVISILTTTGFGTRDIGDPFFGHAARQMFLVMMVIGGCVGSTGGGIKVLRIGILLQLAKQQVYRLRTPPRAVTRVLIDGKPVDEREIYRVSSLFFMWIALLVIGGCCTALLSGWDMTQSFSGMFSALGNIGPCFIPVSGMGQLHALIKIVYIFGMLAGRLEILPVLLLFHRKAWRG